jgi:hypothetical protein
MKEKKERKETRLKKRSLRNHVTVPGKKTGDRRPEASATTNRKKAVLRQSRGDVTWSARVEPGRQENKKKHGTQITLGHSCSTVVPPLTVCVCKGGGGRGECVCVCV